MFKDPIYEGKFLRQYTEILVDSRSPDKTTEKLRYNIQYDSEHNMTSYLEDITEKIVSHTGTLFRRTYQKQFLEGRYDTDKNLLHSVEIVNDEYGSLKTTFDGEYSELGELEKSSRIQTLDDDITLTTDFTAISYDDHFQLLESEEVITDSRHSDKPVVRKFKAGVGDDYGYNSLGDITSYTEQWQDETGRTITRQWTDAQYTQHRQIAGYKEKLTDETGAELFKEWTIQDIEFGYDRLNHVKGYTETTQYGDLTFNRLVTSIRYDSLGQQSEYDETYTITGTDELSNTVDYLKTTNRTSAVYLETGELNGYQEHISENAEGDIAINKQTQISRQNMTTRGYDETRTITGTELDHTINTTRSNVEYAPNKIVSAYEDKMIDSGSIDAHTIIKRDNIQFGAMNQVYGYDEVIFNSATPGKGSDETKRSVTDSKYNLFNQLLSKNETTQTIEGITYTATQQNIQYNGIGQEIKYQRNETVLKTGKNEVTTQTVRNNTTYNTNGLLDGYQQVSTNNVDTWTRTTNWSADSFNQHAQVAGHTNTTRTTGDTVDFTVETTRSDISYQSLDMNDELKFVGQIGSYDETTLNSASPDLVSQKQMRQLKYDSYGHTAGYVERKHDYHTSDLTILDNVIVTTRLSSVYDQNTFELISYKDEIEQLGDGDGAELYVKTTVGKSDIIYDTNDRTISYKETSQSSSAPDRIRNVDWSAQEFDHNNQVTAYTEITNELGPGLDKTTTLIRTNIQFNAVNQLYAFDETTISDAAVDKTTTKTRTSTNYNTLGQTNNYNEIISDVGEGLVSSRISLERMSTSYNRFALQNAYQQQSVSSIVPDLTTTTSQSNVLYNRAGQITNSATRTQGTGDGLATDTTQTRTNTQYNTLGQQSAYNDNIETVFAEGNDIKQKQLTNIIYDTKDRQFSFTETTQLGDLTTQTNRTQTQYTDLGQLQSYQDTITESDPANYSSQTQRNWSGLYNENSQLTSFQQTDAGTMSAPGLSTFDVDRGINRDVIVYNGPWFGCFL